MKAVDFKQGIEGEMQGWIVLFSSSRSVLSFSGCPPSFHVLSVLIIMIFQLKLSCSDHNVLSLIIWLSCLGYSVPAPGFRLPGPGCTVLAALSQLSFSGHALLAILFLLSCSGYPVLVHSDNLFWLPWPCAFVLPVMFCLSSLPGVQRFQLSCQLSPPVVLSRLSCPGCLVTTVLPLFSSPICLVLSSMFWPYCPSSSIPGYPVLAVMYQLFYPVPSQAILSWLSCTSCSIRLSCPPLPYPGCSPCKQLWRAQTLRSK